MSSKCPPDTDILPLSKKISKSKSLSSPGDDSKAKAEGNDGKKYKTVDSPTKKKILLDLKKAIILMGNNELTPEDISTPELLDMLDRVDLGTYNKMLTKVLTKHFPNFIATTRSLTQWRRKIKGWVNSSDKPENRGGLLIAHDKLGIFRDRVIQILKSMPARVFLTLRNRILEVLEEFHYDTKDSNQIREFNRNTCSKHWWFNFMRRNQDIKDLWESIPLERMLHKDKHGESGNHKEDSTDDSSPLPNPPDTKGEPLTLPNPVMFKMMAESAGLNFAPFPASLLQTMQEGLPMLGEALAFTQTNSGEMVKKEEEFASNLAVRKEMAIETKVEETKNTNQIITKNEEEATKTETIADNIMQREPQMPINDLSAPQIDYLPMLLQQKKLIDFLILMRLKRGY